MAISQEDIRQMLDAVKAESLGVQELETADSLSGVMSLPGVRGEKLVNVPLELLGRPAEEAAKTAYSASAAADASAKAARSAAMDASAKASAAHEASRLALRAAEKAGDAAAREVFLSETEYEALETKDEGKTYYTYEDGQA